MEAGNAVKSRMARAKLNMLVSSWYVTRRIQNRLTLVQGWSMTHGPDSTNNSVEIKL